MTQQWRDDGGELKVWWHGLDVSTDPPVGSTGDWGLVWPEDGAPAEAETLLLGWLKKQALPNDIGYQDAMRILIDIRAGEWEKV